jgi:hypothetical protein
MMMMAAVMMEAGMLMRVRVLVLMLVAIAALWGVSATVMVKTV